MAILVPDYANQVKKPHGVFYNSRKKIGGISYYNPLGYKPSHSNVKQEPITQSTSKNDILDLFSESSSQAQSTNNPTNSQDLNPYVNSDDDFLEMKSLSVNGGATNPNSDLDEASNVFEQALQTSNKNVSKNNDYIISINGHLVNFSDFDIERPNLTKADQEWLVKAHYYFINAKKNGNNIGSAPVYTTVEILESIWATAEHVGINPKRFMVQLFNESRFNPNVKGKSGERGVGQFLRTTAKEFEFDWEQMRKGSKTFPYQILSAAELVKRLGEEAYNGKGAKGRRYENKISDTVREITAYNLR